MSDLWTLWLVVVGAEFLGLVALSVFRAPIRHCPPPTARVVRW